MTPLKLTLKGFIGVRDGMGRDELTLDMESVAGALVAITGPNGTGKTTVLDNLHPYRIMPSRASSYSVGGFSFWGQIYGGEASKELVWSHGGEEYKSVLIFRSTGKTKGAEAYLQMWAEDSWKPYTAPDGTLSDGKATTYDTCVEAILGSPELYFTAAFSCQGRKLLSGYTNAEIKSLLSSLLGLGHIEDLATEANAQRLTVERKLQSVRDAGAEYTDVPSKLQAVHIAMGNSNAALDDQTAKRDSIRTTIGTYTDAVATAEAQQAQVQQSEERAVSLRQQLAALAVQEAQDLTEVRAARDAAQQAVADARGRHVNSVGRLNAQLRGQQSELATQEGLVTRRAEVDKAIADLKANEATLAELDTKLAACEKAGAELKDAPTKAATARGDLTSLDRELTDIAVQRQALERRSALVDRVPCAGTEMQNTCELLADARNAKTEIAALEQRKTAVLEKHTAAVKTLDEAEALAKRHAELQQEWRTHNTSRSALLTAMDPIRSVAAMKVSVEQAELAATRIRGAIAETEKAVAEANDARDAELKDLEAKAATAASKPLAVQDRYKAQREPIQKDLDSLPTSTSATIAVADAEKSLLSAQASLDDIEKALDATKVGIAKLEAEKAQLEALAEKAASHDARVTAAADDLAHWTTLCKALGPNGVIALVIDDAGPTLAALTNELLRDCYGPRFSVRIDTQHENADGTYREDFDIKVFDANSGDAKSLVDMSGGERIWINDALCAAVAVYMNLQTGRDYGCRMSDESDGALDAEKKAQYMAMKREVLKIAGLEREFFISHSTSTWELADAVIDLGKFVTRNKPTVAEAA